MDCKLRRIVDYERSTLVCTKSGLCEYYPVYVTSYNHTMQPLRRKCIYKRSDNFKVILNQFFYGEKSVVPDGIMETIRGEIHDETNILYPYEIPLTIPILECISDDLRNRIEDRIGKLRGELTERNKEIDILKGEASKQINQIRESITKVLHKETGTLGERIRTLFKELGITIVSILTAVGMAIGVLIEALFRGPSTSTPTSGGTSGGDKKGGARECIKTN